MKLFKLLLLPFIVCLATNLALAQSNLEVMMTPWQMHPGKGVIKLATPLSESAADEAFEHMTIPSENDGHWAYAPVDLQGRITFQGDNPTLDGNDCFSAVDYTYFQSSIWIPKDLTKIRIAMTFDFIEDGGKLFIFNSDHPEGATKTRTQILKGSKTFSANIVNYIKKGEMNRFVLVHVNDCPGSEDKIIGGQVKMEKEFYTPVSHPFVKKPTYTEVPVNGATQAFDISQPSLPLNYIIAIDGGRFPLSQNMGEPILGEIRLFAGNFAPKGWAFCHGQILTILPYNRLFEVLNTKYGGDGRATFHLPDLRGRVPIGSADKHNNDLGLYSYPGENLTTTLSPANLPSHKHERGNNTGGGQPFNVEQPYLTMNYIINLKGEFPTVETGLQGRGILGEIKLFGSHLIPPGYAKCDGQLLQFSEHTTLFSLIGTIYGGDGRTTFALPDLRGRTTIHYGQAPGLSEYTLGQEGGYLTQTLTEAQLPPHTHWSDGKPQSKTTTPVNLMMPYMAVCYAIIDQGLFPARIKGEPAAQGMTGEIRMFAFNTLNKLKNTKKCDGQVFNLSSNTLTLFSLLGTTYGGDGRTTFTLPNLRGRVVVGVGQGQGLYDRKLGARFGKEEITLTVNNIPNHKHPTD